MDLPIDDLDQLFALGAAPPSQAVATPISGKKQAPTTLISLQRAQNISIMLQRIKLPFPQIRASLLAVDDGLLTLDHLKALKSCLPSADEMELVREFNGEISSLSPADRFFKEIMGIPKLNERLASMLYMRRFEMDLEELKPDLKVLRDAVEEMNASIKFKKVLQTVLMVGNMLNASTYRGGASGFQLGDLLKLRDTKPTSASAGTPTLLHYIVRVLNKSDKTLVGFLDDCAHVEAAARVSTQSVMATVNLMISGNEALKEEMKVLRKIRISSADDRFLQVADEFVSQSASQLKALQSTGSKINQDLIGLLSYYGEDASQTKPEDFFSTVASFGQALMRAEVEVLEADRRAEREAQKAQKASFGAGLKKLGLKVQHVGPEVRGPLAAKEEEEAKARAQARARLEVETTSSNNNTVSPANAEEAEEATDQLSPVSDLTPTGNLSKFRSWGAAAAASVGRGTSNGNDASNLNPASAAPNSATASSNDAMRRSYGRGRGQFDEAIKDLRSGVRVQFGNNNNFGSGRKSLRMGASGDRNSTHRPLSRIFMTGDN